MGMNQLTKIVVAFELYEQRLPITHIASKLGVERTTIHRWVNKISRISLERFLEDYLQAKKGERAKRRIDPLIKVWIYNYREKYKDPCGQKIRLFLKEEKNLDISTTTIYKVLREKYKLRSKWKKNQVRGPVPKASKPREVIQMDSVDFGDVFAFTGVDIFSKDVSVKLYPTLTSSDGKDFLIHAFEERFQHTELLQTDGGPEFKDQFKRTVYLYANRFRIARPYRKNEQAYIESFNRSLRKECLGWGKFNPKDVTSLQREVDDYLVYYHTKRPHLGLGMKTPNQYLEEHRLLHI